MPPRLHLLSGLCTALLLTVASHAQRGSELPPFAEVAADFEKVISTADGQRSLYTIYVDQDTHRMLAELPPAFEHQRIFIATSIAGGGPMTAWQWRDLYAYWVRHDDQLVLMEPNITRQVGGGPREAELRSAAKRTFTDRVVTSVPIVTNGPGGGPVIDLGALLAGQSRIFTGMGGNAQLAQIGRVKAFPQNIEIPVTMPMADGAMTTLHYSISIIPQTGYQPREADERIGYFMTVFRDLARNDPGGSQFTRYINRWNLQKRDPELAMSPPKQPIIFYVEHTVPVRYRRYVREGILEWNKAFEKVGIIDAIEVRQQDEQTGAFMDIYPEDVRYNFFRWITSERPFAMGPSRVNPETGEILDANIIFDDSMLKHYAMQYRRQIEAFGFDGIDPQARKWAEQRPLWDPISRYQTPEPLRDRIRNDNMLRDSQKADILGEHRHPLQDGLLARVVQQNLGCGYASGKAAQMRTAQLAMRMMPDQLLGEQPDGPTIDGVPEAFLGLILKEIVMHEVGHTIGLRHNFKASSWLSIDEYRQRQGEANVASVMDYNPIYIPADDDGPRGDWVTPTIGPYDYWAIEYGYTLDESRRQELLGEVATDEYQFATDEDASYGPDPLVARFDLGAAPLNYARQRMELVRRMREQILDKAVLDGESWDLARQAYDQLLAEQLNALRIASRYVGGVHVHRDRKADPDARDPHVPTDADDQRAALAFVIEHAFNDDAFDLRPEVLRRLPTDKHRHWGNVGSTQEAYAIHDRIAQIQSFALLYLMNPGTLTRVLDNEMRADPDADMLTVPDVMEALYENIFAELDASLDRGRFDNRQPMISSLRRNLQSETVDRLIDLALDGGWMPRPVGTIARSQLRQLDRQLTDLLEHRRRDRIDAYSIAHLEDVHQRVTEALNAIRISSRP